MFEKDARALIHMMGHSGTIPSAIRGEDIAEALQQLETALKAQTVTSTAETQTDDDECTKVSTNVRAYPLLQLLKAAASKQKMVMWEFEHPIL
jgi:hypothetical protein